MTSLALAGAPPAIGPDRRGLAPVLGTVCGAAAVAALVALTGLIPALIALTLLGAVLIMVVRPELAIVLTMFALYVNFPAILTKRHGVAPVLAGSFILLLALPLARAVVLRRQAFRLDRVTGLMLVFLGILLVSSLGAIDQQLALFSVLEYALEGLLLYMLVVNSVRDMATLRRVMWTLVAAGALVSALTLYQEVTGSYEQEFGGLAYRNYEDMATDAGGSVAKRRTWDRAQGPVNDPNRFAQILIVLLPMTIFLQRTARTRAARLGAAAAGVLVLIGMSLTLSRGAYVALAVIGVVMLVVKWARLWRVVAAVALLALALPMMTPHFVPRLMSISGVGALVSGEPAAARTADSSTLLRTTAMLAALRVSLDHPVLGVGPGQFAPFYVREYASALDVRFRDLDRPYRAHNLYLELAAELGLVGLAAFLVIVGTVLYGLWRARGIWRGVDPERSDLATALALSLIAYLSTGLFLHLNFLRYYWLLVALAGVALHVTAARGRRAHAGTSL